MKRTNKSIMRPAWEGVDLAAVKRLQELFDADRKRFKVPQLSDDDLGDAAGYWLWYPLFAEQLGDNPRNREPERAAAYDALVRVHSNATEALMKVAEQNGIDGTPLWKSADLCRRLFAEPDGKYRLRKLSAITHDTWPDCLEGCVAEISSERMDLVRNGLAILTQLSIKLDVKPENPTDWSLPEQKKVWANRFGDVTIRTLGNWAKNGSLVWKLYGSNEWRVYVHCPRYVKWEKNRFDK